MANENELFIDYKKVNDPQPIDSLVQIVTYLVSGETLRVVGGEKSQKQDILIKASDLEINKPYTLVSMDTKADIPGIFKKYWAVTDISLNYLIKYDVYLESDFDFKNNSGIKVNDVVKYVRRDTGENDVAKVIEVLADSDMRNYAFKLSGDSFIYGLSEINLIK